VSGYPSGTGNGRAAGEVDRAPLSTVTLVIVDHGPEPAWHRDGGVWLRFDAQLPDYPLVRGLGASPWEAVHRLVSNHRGLLERRWSGAVNQARLAPDAVIELGEWEVGATGERVELGCVVMRSVYRLVPEEEPLEIVRPELPVRVRGLAEFVLGVWAQARGLGT
jgi:hypothetical protein